MKIVPEYEIREFEVEILGGREAAVALAHCTCIHVEGKDVDALRVSVRVCLVLWVWQSSDQSD